MKTDIEISNAARLHPITEIAEKLGVDKQSVEPYGHFKAKLNILAPEKRGPRGKLILVTAINPTPAGEGKTTTSVGLADALNRIGRKTVLALREPSLGPASCRVLLMCPGWYPAAFDRLLRPRHH